MIGEVKHMKTHDIIRGNLEHWLQQNNKSCQWLADELGVSQSMIQQSFLVKGTIPSKHIEALSKIMNVPMKNLVKSNYNHDNLTIQIRGQFHNRHSKQGLKEILFDIEDYMSLKD